jgi:F-type H+-transporting ATPase subunit alpha
MEAGKSGKILEVKDGIAVASGLEEVGANELVEIYTKNFETVKGIALNLDQEFVSIIIIGDYLKVNQGDSVSATGQLPEITVNKNYLGRIVDPLGKPLDGKGPIADEDSKTMLLDRVAPGVIDRKDVDRPLQTGIMAIDAMIPIGRGQRELIIGDRLTGKTAIAIDTMINQRDKNCVSIYVSIGQKVSKVAQISKKLEEYDALKNTVIVMAPVSTSAAMQYLAAYAGTAIGEYFAEKGEDALVVYDDLTKHAQAYREVSLLLRRPSGREAYPGDIFYLHSKILERSIQYSDANGGGSLTALPIIETQAGDISAYIPTNVISITDGQIFLETSLFSSGQKPAISVGLSVSRVGGNAQTKGMKQVAGQMKLDLAQYRELAAFAQFGSDLDKETKRRLDKGARMMETLKQNQYKPKTVAQMISVIFAANDNKLEQMPLNKIELWVTQFEKKLNASDLVKQLDGSQKLEDKLRTKLAEFIEAFNKQFTEDFLN